MAVDVEGLAKGLAKPGVDYINSVFTKLVPGGEIYLTFALAFIIAYMFKSKYKFGGILLIVLSAIIYAAFRYLGIGGA